MMIGFLVATVLSCTAFVGVMLYAGVQMEKRIVQKQDRERRDKA